MKDRSPSTAIGKLCILATLLTVGFTRSQGVSAEGDLVLFSFDDHAFPWRENLKLVMENPTKHPGNPVLRPGAPAAIDGYGANLSGTILHVAGNYRMWYIASPQPHSLHPGDAFGKRGDPRVDYYRPVAYAESSDGIHWERPHLGLVEFRGDKNNNIVSIEPAHEPYAQPCDFVSVLYDPEDSDPERLYKMAYIHFDMERRYATTATATSPDGLRWKLINTDDVITRGHFENTSLVKFNGCYFLGGQNVGMFGGHALDGAPVGRTMTVFFSPDFLHWSGGRALAFRRSRYDPKPEATGRELHMGAALWNRGNVLLGIYGQWHGHTRHSTRTVNDGLTIDLGLVLSNDAIHYREPLEDFAFIPRGEAGEWDSIALRQGNAFHNTETETQIWYSHWNTGRDWPPAALPEKHTDKFPSGIGLATLPRDRFGYVTKLFTESRDRATNAMVPRDAKLLSRSIQLDRPVHLYANISDVSSSAALRVDLVDDIGKVLDGCTSEITAESLKGRVNWRGNRPLPIRVPFRVRVTWPAGDPNPQLYAMYIEP